MYSTIRINAGNDKSGNPRRLYLALAEGHLVGVYKENYNGLECITDKNHKAAFRGGEIATTVKEYTDLCRRWNLK